MPSRIPASGLTSQRLDEFLTTGVADAHAEFLMPAGHSTNSGTVAVVQAPEVAKVVHQGGRRVIRKRQTPGYLGWGIDAAVPTGHDPLAHDESELDHRFAPSVRPRIAA